jgi:hypothetical protein
LWPQALEKKRQQQSLLQDEIERINRETIQAKEQKKEQEKLADLKAMEYTKQKMVRLPQTFCTHAHTNITRGGHL